MEKIISKYSSEQLAVVFALAQSACSHNATLHIPGEYRDAIIHHKANGDLAVTVGEKETVIGFIGHGFPQYINAILDLVKM